MSKADDTISRTKAIEAGKELCETCDEQPNGWCGSCRMDEYLKAIETLPPAQPEIIYCKDCARYDGMGHCERDVRDILGYGREWNEDDYCSDGIRKE